MLVWPYGHRGPWSEDPPIWKPWAQKKQSSDPAAGLEVSSLLIPAEESVTRYNFAELGKTHKKIQSLVVVMQWGNRGAEVTVGMSGIRAVDHLPLGD